MTICYQPIPLSGKDQETRRDRCMLYRIGHDFVMKILKGQTVAFRIVENPLPEDAELVRLAYDIERNQFVAVVHSETFPETKTGCPYPNAPEPLLRDIPLDA